MSDPTIPVLILKQISHKHWQIETSYEIALSGIFHGSAAQAIVWAQTWVSTWPHWSIDLSEAQHNESGTNEQQKT